MHRAAAAIGLSLFLAFAAQGQDAQRPLLELGDAVVTGFSGTLAPDPESLLPDTEAIDETHRVMGELQKEMLQHLFAMRVVLDREQAEMFDKSVVQALTADAR